MRLVCFGDSFTASADIPAEDIALGRVPSWIDLLSERWDCAALTRGINGTGPLELLHQIQNFGEFLPGDRVFCAFSSVKRFCLSPYTPTIHHLSELAEPHEHYNNKNSAMVIQREIDMAIPEVSRLDMQRIIQAQRWYDLFLNNEYREYILHYAVFTALDGIAAANPQAEFYVKYCFIQDYNLCLEMNLQNKFFKLLEGDMFSICGEQSGMDITNHFTVDSVGDFVNYLDGAMR
jgi:hypothetical protein